jgi:hypothetical protein
MGNTIPLLKDEHSENVLFGISPKLLGSATLPNEVQFSKRPVEIDVTEFGSVIFFRLAHPLNASFPIVLSDAPSVIEGTFAAPLNAESPIVVTPAGRK